MKIAEIYEKYKIMPSLQLHMFRVAGVGALICDNININIDRNSVITACLLHDMGNIIKFKLDLFPEFLAPEGFDYWQNIQKEYFNKYGKDEHVATMAIANEIGVNARAMELLESIGFSKANLTYASSDYEKKIAAYSDMRVEPYGVVSLESRLEDGHKRFKVHKPGFDDEAFFQEMAGYLRKIEKQIFGKSSIDADTITDEKVSDYVKKMSDYEISVHKS